MLWKMDFCAGVAIPPPNPRVHIKPADADTVNQILQLAILDANMKPKAFCGLLY
jgi:hypothetical protein